MNEKIELGKVNRLKIDRESDHGFYLVSENGEDVLLPNRYVIKSMKIGDEIDVFIYSDSEDRLVSTTERPKAMLGEFGYFKAVDVTSFGAFVDWGLPKDLLVPKSVQKYPFKVGKSYILRVSYDEETDRLIGSAKVQRYLKTDTKKLQKNSEVDILIIAKTPLGFKVIVDNLYEGMIYHNEIFEKVSIGDQKEGYIKTIRDDGKLDISLQPTGDQKDKAAMEKVLSVLKNSGGDMPYNSKTDAQMIQNIFGLSKKSFKKALTQLQEKNMIYIENGVTFKNPADL